MTLVDHLTARCTSLPRLSSFKGKGEVIHMLKKFWLLMTILWCAGIYWFTATPSFTSKNTGSIVQETIQDSYSVMNKDTNNKTFYLATGHLHMAIRKSAHVVLFGVLAYLTWNTLHLKRNRYIISWLFVTVYAASDEWHQSFVPGRGPAVHDVVLDSTAAIVLLLIIFLWQSKGAKKLRISPFKSSVERVVR